MPCFISPLDYHMAKSCAVWFCSVTLGHQTPQCRIPVTLLAFGFWSCFRHRHAWGGWGSSGILALCRLLSWSSLWSWLVAGWSEAMGPVGVSLLLSVEERLLCFLVSPLHWVRGSRVICPGLPGIGTQSCPSCWPSATHMYYEQLAVTPGKLQVLWCTHI